MKKICFYFFALILMTSSFASANCLGEAQIIARVASAQVDTGINMCVVNIDFAQVSFYAESGVCPLSIQDTEPSGVRTRLQNNNCSLNSGDVITGVLVLKPDGSIELE